jgi:hypothetical protein
VRTPENAEMLVALARHIFEHGVEGRFYHQVRKYHHEGGKVYWSMDDSAEATDLVNRCDEDQTYEARVKAGTLPRQPDIHRSASDRQLRSYRLGTWSPRGHQLRAEVPREAPGNVLPLLAVFRLADAGAI